MNDIINRKDKPVACDLGALEPGEKERHAELARHLRQAVIRVEEIPGGFAATITESSEVAHDLDEWVRLEAKCCPFLRFEVTPHPGEGDRKVKITGPRGTKDFLRAHYGFGTREESAGA